MSRIQDYTPLVSALQRLRTIIEHRPLDELEKETSYILHNFDVNQATLKPNHVTKLNEFVKFLNDHSNAVIVSIIGRASQTGPELNNEQLSFNRADAVRAYLRTSGVSPSRIGPQFASGSKLPVVDAPGSEEAINRSVEIICHWKIKLIEPPSLSSTNLSTRWKIDLVTTFGLGIFVAAGQIQIGTLTNRTSGESRSVEAFLLGPELGKSIGPVATASTSTSAFEEGEFETPHPVDFNYFDGQPIAMFSIGASSVGGVSSTKLYFPRGGLNDPSTRFADIEMGVTIGIGAAFLFGILNVHDS